MTQDRKGSRRSLTHFSLKSLVPAVFKSVPTGSPQHARAVKTPRFRHAPLPNTGESIRLLHVYPATADGIIRGDVRHVSLQLPGLRYAALSYRWGDPSPYAMVLLNGKSFHVHQALWEFLDYFSRSDVVHEQDFYYLWTDGICIDQSVASEKSHQVGMMKHIFSSARPVLIWLGIPDESTKFVAKIASSIQSSPEMGLREVIMAFSTEPEVQRLKSLHNDDDEHLALLAFAAAVLEMYDSDYWERMWIFQEVLLASHAILVCGHQLVHWKTWALISDFVRDRFKPDGSFGFTITDYKGQVDRGLDAPSLETLLSLTIRQQCSDPRDHIYSLLGLLRGDEALFPANYAIDTLELWHRILEHFQPVDFPLFVQNLEAALDIHPECLSDSILQKNGPCTARYSAFSLSHALKYSDNRQPTAEEHNIIPRVGELCICRCEACLVGLGRDFGSLLLSTDIYHIAKLSTISPTRVLLRESILPSHPRKSSRKSQDFGVVAAVQILRLSTGPEMPSFSRYRYLVYHLPGAEYYNAISKTLLRTSVGDQMADDFHGNMHSHEHKIVDGLITTDAAFVNHFLYATPRAPYPGINPPRVHDGDQFEVIWRNKNMEARQIIWRDSNVNPVQLRVDGTAGTVSEM